MDSMSRRSSSRIATKKSLAATGVESLTIADQGPPAAPNPEPTPSPPPQVQGGNKRKAVSVTSPTGSHDKKLKRTIADAIQPKEAVVDIPEAVTLPVENGSGAEPGKSTERPTTPSCQEYPESPEKPWVPPVIERRNPLVNRFEVCAFLFNHHCFSN